MTEIKTEAAYCPVCGPDALRRKVARSIDFEYATSGAKEWEFHQCLVCDTLILDPRPVPEELATIYPSNYYAFSLSEVRSLGYWVKGRLDERAARVYLRHYPGTGLICDVGAGDGRLVEILGRTEPGYTDRIYGIEPGERGVEAARQRGLDVRLGSMEGFDWAPESHGLVILQQVIEHVRDPRQCVEFLSRALVPGGVLIVETPNSRALDARLFGERYWGGFHTPRHFHIFNVSSLTQLASLHGLELVEHKALPSPNFWIQSVHHWASEQPGRSWLTKVFRPHPPPVVPLAAFTSLDLLTSALFDVTSNMRLIFRKRG